MPVHEDQADLDAFLSRAMDLAQCTFVACDAANLVKLATKLSATRQRLVKGQVMVWGTPAAEHVQVGRHSPPLSRHRPADGRQGLRSPAGGSAGAEGSRRGCTLLSRGGEAWR